MKKYEFDFFNEDEYIYDNLLQYFKKGEILMIISGITIRSKKDEKGKEQTSYTYHLSQETDFGYKPFYDFWSRDAINGADIGSECEPILSTFKGELKIFGLRLV